MIGIKNYIDISWPICPDMTSYKDRSVVRISATKEFERDGVRESMVTLGSHTGTHIDAPAHFLAAGKTTEAIPLDAITGSCVVIDMTHCRTCISRNDLLTVSNLLTANSIILFKTDNSFRKATEPFHTEFVYIDESAALYLVEHAIKAVGIDYLGIERNQPGHETHIALMTANIVIIEGLRLAHVVSGNYFLYCLPLSLVGMDGAPARALLVPDR